jgi:hypothetical protein
MNTGGRNHDKLSPHPKVTNPEEHELYGGSRYYPTTFPRSFPNPWTKKVFKVPFFQNYYPVDLKSADFSLTDQVGDITYRRLGEAVVKATNPTLIGNCSLAALNSLNLRVRSMAAYYYCVDSDSRSEDKVYHADLPRFSATFYSLEGEYLDKPVRALSQITSSGTAEKPAKVGWMWNEDHHSVVRNVEDYGSRVIASCDIPRPLSYEDSSRQKHPGFAVVSVYYNYRGKDDRFVSSSLPGIPDEFSSLMDDKKPE